MKKLIFVFGIICYLFISCEPKIGKWDQRQKPLSFSFTDSNTLFNVSST